MFHQPTYLLYISYTYLPTYLLFYLLTNKSQSFTRLVTQGETRCQLTYSWRSHPQVSHKRLPMDGGGLVVVVMVALDSIWASSWLPCLSFFPQPFALKPFALKGLCHLWNHSMVFLFFELESTSPDTHTQDASFEWVKGPLLFACKPSHHSISQTFSTFYARKLYSPLASPNFQVYYVVGLLLPHNIMSLKLGFRPWVAGLPLYLTQFIRVSLRVSWKCPRLNKNCEVVYGWFCVVWK